MSVACPSFLAKYAPGLCKPVDIYCERTGPEYWSEPLNAISNAAFLVAAVLIWRLQDRVGNAEYGTSNKFMAVLIAVVGTGSFMFHTFANEWSRWADVIPILILMLMFCWIAMTRFFGWSKDRKAIVLVAFLLLTFLIEVSDKFVTRQFEGLLGPISNQELIAKTLAGGAFYVPTLILMIGFGLGLLIRNRAAGIGLIAAALVFALSYSLRSLDGFVCEQLKIGTHYFWHICNAAVLYLLMRVVVRHAT